MSEGVKFDKEKVRWDLLDSQSIEELAKVLTFGAKKYGDRNWEKGMKWSRPFAALMRHMWAWWRGEETDPETGLSHLAHAMCNVMFLLAYEIRHSGEDDRPDVPTLPRPTEGSHGHETYRRGTGHRRTQDS